MKKKVRIEDLKSGMTLKSPIIGPGGDVLIKEGTNVSVSIAQKVGKIKSILETREVDVEIEEKSFHRVSIPIDDIKEGMILAEPLKDSKGKIILDTGFRLTQSVIPKLKKLKILGFDSLQFRVNK